MNHPHMRDKQAGVPHLSQLWCSHKSEIDSCEPTWGSETWGRGRVTSVEMARSNMSGERELLAGHSLFC
jgi:hypothetical protein